MILQRRWHNIRRGVLFFFGLGKMVLEDGDILFVYIISESYLFSDLVDDLGWDACNLLCTCMSF